MAGYFDYLGKVFTEKGAWYKILTIMALQIILISLHPKELYRDIFGVSPNISGIILCVLISILLLGFRLQIYNLVMNNKDKQLPDIDFMGMLAIVLKFIPFWTTWFLYFVGMVLFFGFFIIVFGVGARVTQEAHSAFVILVVVAVLLILFFRIMIQVLEVIASKSFSYNYVLNPLTPFRIIPIIAGQLFLLLVQYGLIYILLLGVLYGGTRLLLTISLTSFDNGIGANWTLYAMWLLITVDLYLFNVCTFAYNLRLADIVKTRLADTEYLDSDYDVQAADNNHDDEDEFAGYAHNSDEEE